MEESYILDTTNCPTQEEILTEYYQWDLRINSLTDLNF